MKVSYTEKIIPDDFVTSYGWTVKKPTLKNIREIGFNNFYLFESFLNMDLMFFLDNFAPEPLKKFVDDLDPEKRNELSFYDLVIIFEALSQQFKSIFEFFSPYSIECKDGAFFQVDQNESDEDKQVKAHIITKDTFEDLRETLLYVCNIEKEKEEEFKVAKGAPEALTRRLYELFKKKREEERKKKKIDRNYELPNIIASIASRSPAYTFFNIWDLTICQLYILFTKMQYNDQFNMSATSVSVWGDEKNKFDSTLWFKTLDES